MATSGWRCVTCGTGLTHRLRCKQALSPETGTYGSFPLARRLQQPKDSGEQELKAFRRAVENELTDLVALVGHATAHSILTHAHCLLEGYAKKCKLPAKTSAMVFGLIWFGTGLTAQFIEDEVELERKLLNVKNLTRKDVGPAKVFWTNAMNVVDKFALGAGLDAAPQAGSRLCIPCAYKKCKSQLDVKNVGSKLKVKRIRVQADKCRTSLRAHSKWVRFCCERHRDNCLLPKSMVAKRGPREPLDAAQLTDLFHVLIRDGAPWAAVAALLCMSCGERAGCIVKAKFGWLQNLSPAAKDLPCIGIEKVNGKTKPRNIPLPWELARLLHKWIHEQPLVGGPSGNAGNSQWPFEGQSTSSDAYMFPSATVHGLRLWDIAIGDSAWRLLYDIAWKILARICLRQGKQLFMLLGLEGEAAMSTAMYSDHMFKPFFFHFASATARLRCPVADNLSVAVAAVLRVLRMLFKLVQAPGFGKRNFRLSLLFAMPTMKRRGRFC
ncbi:unnamed protein product [Symbiodinium sp. KB8]|nr:unnamed protein product [Symbiodinium sp. KB8]